MKRCSGPFYNLFADNRDAVLHRTVSLQGATADERRADGHLALAVVAVLLHQHEELQPINVVEAQILLSLLTASFSSPDVDEFFHERFAKLSFVSRLRRQYAWMCHAVGVHCVISSSKIQYHHVIKKVHRRVCINKNNMIFHETRLEYESSLSFDRF
jgi:hypothetical protein